MRLYLASSFDYADLCELVRRAVEADGHEVPDVWWNVRTKDALTNVSEGEFYSNATVKAIAARHWRTIDSCDAVILVADGPEKTFTGANVEVGYAIARGKPVLTVGGVKRSAMYVPAIHCRDASELRKALDVIAGCPR